MGLLEKLESSPIRSGSYTVFVRLSKRRALKLFLTEEMRDDAYDYQRAASAHGLGPNVYAKIDSVTYKNTEMFGYYTEVVTVLNRRKMRHMRIYNRDVYDKITWKIYNESDALRIELARVGFDFCDNHIYNVGWKNGRMVCVDFDSGGRCLQNELYDQQT